MSNRINIDKRTIDVKEQVHELIETSNFLASLGKGLPKKIEPNSAEKIRLKVTKDISGIKDKKPQNGNFNKKKDYGLNISFTGKGREKKVILDWKNEKSNNTICMNDYNEIDPVIREILELKLMYGKDVTEIAEEVKLSVGLIRKKVDEGIRMLKYFQDYPPVTPEEILKADLSKIPVERLRFSVYVYNLLKRKDINNLNEIISKDEQELLNLKDVGPAVIKEIKEKLENLGLHLL
jgi:hypothetical protein